MNQIEGGQKFIQHSEKHQLHKLLLLNNLLLFVQQLCVIQSIFSKYFVFGIEVVIIDMQLVVHSASLQGQGTLS